MRFLTQHFAALVIVTAGCIFGAPADAQVPENKLSVVVFDVQLNKIRSSPIYQQNGGDAIMQNIETPPGLDISTVERVFGSVGYPPSIQSLDMRAGDKIPLEFFVRIMFSDAASASSMLEDIADNSNLSEENGKTYYRPKTDTEPQNISICQINPTTLELATDLYRVQQSRNFQTGRLGAAWKKMPSSAVRVAVDAETPSELVQQGVQMASAQLPPAASIMLVPVNDISTIALAFDFSSDNLMTLELTGKDEQKTIGLEGTLGGMMAMVQGQAQMGLQQAPPEMAQVMNQIMASMKFTREGNSLSMKIPRPEGFEQAVAMAAKQAQRAAGVVAKRNNMKQALLAMHNYFATFRSLPWESPDPRQNDKLSWRTRLLPFVEEQALYEAMEMEKGPDEAPNSGMTDQMPMVFGPGGKTSDIQIILHERMPKSLSDIIDGTSNTIAMIQLPSKEPWMNAPGGISIDDAIKAIENAGGPVVVGLYDGSVMDLDASMGAEQIRAMLTYNGKEIVNF